MIRSMTGYGQGSAEVPGLRVTVELRSLNNRFTDLRLRLPAELAPREVEIRRRVHEVVRRGRVELTLALERTGGDESRLGLNRPMIESVLATATALRSDYGVEGKLDLGTLLSLPGVVRAATSDPVLGEEEHQAVSRALDEALQGLDRERIREGEELRADLLERLNRMLKIVVDLRDRAREVPDQVRKKLMERVETLTRGMELDPARLAQEAAFLADRADVTEELVRLEGHLRQLKSLLADPDGDPVGKRLDFLVQEVHRETNTVSNKSADLELSRLALALKAETEKVREQTQNLE